MRDFFASDAYLNGLVWGVLLALLATLVVEVVKERRK